MTGRVDVYSDNFFLGGSGSSRGRRKNTTLLSETKSAFTPKSNPPPARTVQVSPMTRTKTGCGSRSHINASVRPGTAPGRMERNFIKVNKEALAHGLVNSREQQKYRELQTGYVPVRSKKETRDKSIKLPGKDHVYGIKSLPGEDLKGTLSLQHGREWLEKRHEQLSSQRKARPHTTTPQAATTRTVMLRRQIAARGEPDIPPWQMSQFRDVPARVSTFRNQSSHTTALKKHHQGGAMNLGSTFGHGIPRNPAGTSRNL